MEHEEKRRHLDHELIELIHDLKLLIKFLLRGKLFPTSSSMTLTAGEEKMPLTVKLGDNPGTAKYQEFNAAGGPVPPVGTVQYASDNTSVATVDPSTGVLGYVGVGTCNIAAVDSGVSGGLPAADSLTVEPAATDNTPVSSTMTLTAG
jgi:hypothetical protein